MAFQGTNFKKPHVKTSRIDYAAIAAAGGIPKGPSKQVTQVWKTADFEKKLAKAYAKVNVRDDNHSRVTGKPLLASTKNDKARREHNHLANRATAPDKITDPANIFLVSTFEHGFITRNELLIHGTHANKELRFSWNPNVFKDGKAVPFRIPAAMRYVAGKKAAA